MGNESCKLKGLEIDKTAVEVNDFWALSNATACTTTNDDGKQYLSVFQGEPVVDGQLWLSHGPMERVTRNLMIFRHPYILRYITNWDQGGQKCLATERVQPLRAIVIQQSDIQICLGLRTILCALIFLVEKAMARHLNICIQSIYVTETGNWRLAGFEYVWKSQDINKSLLDLVRPYRYKNAIDPNESTNNEHSNTDGIEQYAFATLCEEIFKQSAIRNKQQYNVQLSIPHVQDFHEYCSNHLKHKNGQMRPKLSAILLHPYFNHEFVLIHAFLFELPLKNNQEKQEFFVGIIDRLRYFDENLVASLFANDLLSRMVLLDSTAQLCVTPFILHTKAQNNAALFSNKCYRKYLLPIILKMFRVRDAQIRLILLEYFRDYVHLMAAADVHECILSHLKIGLNDTNELLVAKTLQAMAELVPILGAAVVLECERVKLFSDGRPQSAAGTGAATTYWMEPRSITPVLNENMDMEECGIVSGSPLLLSPAVLLSKSSSFSSSPSQTFNSDHYMPPRLSPDGGEDVKLPVNIDTDVNTEENKELISLKRNQSILVANDNHLDEVNGKQKEMEKEEEGDEEAAWSDWDNELSSTQQQQRDNLQSSNFNSTVLHLQNKDLNQISDAQHAFATLSPTHSQNQFRTSLKPTGAAIAAAIQLPKINDDFSQLDIQVKASATAASPKGLNIGGAGELDFFKDMEPIIESCQKYDLNVIKTEKQKQQQHKSDDIGSIWKTASITQTTSHSLDISDILIDSKRFAAFPANEENNICGWNVDDDDLYISTTLKTAKTTPAQAKSLPGNALSNVQ